MKAPSFMHGILTILITLIYMGLKPLCAYIVVGFGVARRRKIFLLSERTKVRDDNKNMHSTKLQLQIRPLYIKL